MAASYYNDINLRAYRFENTYARRNAYDFMLQTLRKLQRKQSSCRKLRLLWK